MAKGTILVVDDEKEIRDLIDIYLIGSLATHASELKQ